MAYSGLKRWVALLITSVLGPHSIAHAQTAYHLLYTSSNGYYTSSTFTNSAVQTVYSSYLTNDSQGTYGIQNFPTLSGLPGVVGEIPANSTVTFSIWMYKTANFGTMYPKATLYKNSGGTLTAVCTATGTISVVHPSNLDIRGLVIC